MLRSFTYATLLVMAAVTAPALAQTAAAPAPPSGGYTGDTLFEALVKLGYAPVRDGSTGAYIKVTAARMDVQVRVGISTNQQFLWLRATLGEIDPAEASSDAVRKLVAVNHEIGPAFYFYNPMTKQFCLNYRHHNGGFTQAKLRSAVQSFTETIRKQEPNWRSEVFARLGTVPAEVSQPFIDQIQGKWRVVGYNNLGTPATAEQLAGGVFLAFDGCNMSVSTSTTPEIVVVDPRRTPIAFDTIHSGGRISCGLMRLEGNRLTIVQESGFGTRPKDFTPNSNVVVLVLERL